MPRWPRNEHTGRTVENCKTHADGLPCPACKSTDTKFKYFNNKKTTQPRYLCLNAMCKKAWTVEGQTRPPYKKRNRAGSNPGVAAHAASQSQDSQPPPPPACPNGENPGVAAPLSPPIAIPAAARRHRT